MHVRPPSFQQRGVKLKFSIDKKAILLSIFCHFTYVTKSYCLKKIAPFVNNISWQTALINHCLTLFTMGLFGAAHGWGGQKGTHSLKSATHILQ